MQNLVVVTLKAQSNIVPSFPKHATSRIKMGSRKFALGVPSEVGVAPIEYIRKKGNYIMCVKERGRERKREGEREKERERERERGMKSRDYITIKFTACLF